jgi:hypothetical protein
MSTLLAISMSCRRDVDVVSLTPRLRHSSCRSASSCHFVVVVTIVIVIKGLDVMSSAVPTCHRRCSSHRRASSRRFVIAVVLLVVIVYLDNNFNGGFNASPLSFLTLPRLLQPLCHHC